MQCNGSRGHGKMSQSQQEIVFTSWTEVRAIWVPELGFMQQLMQPRDLLDIQLPWVRLHICSAAHLINQTACMNNQCLRMAADQLWFMLLNVVNSPQWLSTRLTQAASDVPMHAGRHPRQDCMQHVTVQFFVQTITGVVCVAWPTYGHDLAHIRSQPRVLRRWEVTCIVLGDAGELLVQEALQVGGGGGGSQALHQLQIH